MRKFIIIGLSVGAAVAAGLLAGFTPQVEGPQMRRKAEMHVAKAGPEDMPAPAPDARDNIPSWQVFGSVSVTQPEVTPDASPSSYQTSGPLRVAFDDETIFLVVGEAMRQMEAKFDTENFDPLLHNGQDRAALAAPVPLGFGEALDSLGRPLRFAENRLTLEPECVIPEQQEQIEQPEQSEMAEIAPAEAAQPERSEASGSAEQAAKGEKTVANGKSDANTGGEVGNWVVSARPASTPTPAPAPVNNYDRARRYREWVRQYAERYKLKEDLVLAIIHNESNFSTTLVSSRSAMGLMQILPGTAGGEIHKFIYGRTGSMGYAELTDPETNIRFGTAYLHLLLNRYLGDIENEKSREYCAIASYNMGPNRFLRLFNSNRDRAVEIINGMSSEEIYNRLTSMPIAETRSFVAKVTRSRGGYAEAE